MAVNLTKGQRISLEKEAGTSLTTVVMGLGWDIKKAKGGLLGSFLGSKKEQAIDLDASCILFDDAKNPLDLVWFRQLQSKDGSIVHTGDNRTGEGDGDDEQIIVQLSRVPVNVKTLVFTVNNFTGQNFENVENAFCRIVDQRSGKEIAKYDLSCGGQHTAMVMAKIYRHNGEWKMHAIGDYSHGRTVQDLLPAIMPSL